MPITRDKKIKITEELEDKFKRKKIAVFTDFHGVSVAKAKELRRALKKDGAEYKVAKKTLLDRALEKLGAGVKTKEMQGEIGVAFGYQDEVAPVKSLFKFSKANETFKLLGGILGERILSREDILRLAKLPAREVILSQLVGVLQNPLRGLVTVLGGNVRNLVVVLDKVRSTKSEIRNKS